jgi:hypothetical protein
MMTLETALTAAIGGLVSAIVFMFKHMLHAEKECREDRKALWAELGKLNKISCTLMACQKREQSTESLPDDIIRRCDPSL